MWYTQLHYKSCGIHQLYYLSNHLGQNHFESDGYSLEITSAWTPHESSHSHAFSIEI